MIQIYVFLKFALLKYEHQNKINVLIKGGTKNIP